MASDPKQVQAVFLAAVELPAAKRAAVLERECSNDVELRQRVEALLRAHDKPGSFLDKPAVDPGATGYEKLGRKQADDSSEAVLTEVPGTLIGPYKLLEQIGEGGFGVVFMAEQQQPVRRKVALKIVKPGMDTRQVIARFEAERQALALMDHPSIARVLDAGATDSGRPYFIMELVRGVAITQFCDDNQLTPRERLELFVAVCQAVQHAHQKGIIHRDLKPSNVLITLQDGRPQIKVIDFGIAKALGQERLTDKTLFTGFAQMIGTPLYMSPEQAEMSGQDADTRTDIYALGVLLYELLTGTTPFDKERLKVASYDEIRRIIREEEPAKPSTRISTLGQAATTVSAKRKSDPRRLSQLFRGELDWIVMKALEKDRNRRYETASAFAADVQCYLHDEPVQACPPSAVYRFRKFARRNKAALMTAAAIIITVLMAGTVSSGLIWRSNRELRQTLYFQSIALAEREWSANDLSRMEQLLDACPTDLRGWEWRYLRRLRYKGVPLMEHSGAALSVSVSPDGKRLASAGQDGIIKVWDAKTGRELHSFRAHDSHLRSVAFSPDGQSLASGSWDKTVKIWDAQTGQKQHTLTGHKVNVWSVAFSPDCKLLASAGGEGEVGELKLWNAVTGQEVRSFSGHTGRVWCVAFSPDGQRLASGGAADKTVKLWDVQTGQELWTSPCHRHAVFSVAFSRDGRLLASSGGGALWGGGELKVWDASTRQLIHDLHHHTRGIWCVAFSPDGHRLASGSVDSTVKIWDVATGQETLTLRGHVDDIRGVVFSPDGHRLFSCGADSNVRVWDATPLGYQEDEDCLTLPGHTDEVNSVAFHPQDPAVVASASVDGLVKLWNTRTGLPLLNLRDPDAGVISLAFSPDGQLLATVGAGKSVKIRETKSGNLIKILPGQRGDALSVAFLPDGRRIASAGYDFIVRIWDLRTGETVHKLQGHNWAIGCLAASPNGRHVASSSVDGTVRLWDAESGKELAHLPLQKRADGWCLAFSRDGRQLALTCTGGSVEVWDTSTWKRLQSVLDRTGNPRNVAFSPNGRYVAWGSTDSTVKLWQPATGGIQVLRGHTNWVHSVAFSPDGEQIASGSADRTVKIWRTPSPP
jgi:WD40 repeat protein/serine/threonine protein kinase